MDEVLIGCRLELCVSVYKSTSDSPQAHTRKKVGHLMLPDAHPKIMNRKQNQ